MKFSTVKLPIRLPVHCLDLREIKVKKLKVMSVVGTRPEIIRLSRVLAKLDEHCEHILVHTGQNYDFELNEVFFNDLGVRKPDYFLSAAGKNAAETIGQVIIKVDQVLEEIQPEAMLVLGIPTLVSRLFRPSVAKCLFSTWKRVIAVLISVFLKKQTVELWTILRTST